MSSEQENPPEWPTGISPALERQRQFRRRAALLVCATLVVAVLLVWGVLAMMANRQPLEPTGLLHGRARDAVAALFGTLHRA